MPYDAATRAIYDAARRAGQNGADAVKLWHEAQGAPPTFPTLLTRRNLAIAAGSILLLLAVFYLVRRRNPLPGSRNPLPDNLLPLPDNADALPSDAQ